MHSDWQKDFFVLLHQGEERKPALHAGKQGHQGVLLHCGQE
jgi:hypothetical protein